MSFPSEELPADRAEIVFVNRDDILSIVSHFSDDQQPLGLTPAYGLSAFHDAVSGAFAHTEVHEDSRERVNDFINALQDLYESVEEQDQSADVFMVEREDLGHISANLDCLRQVICIQHVELQHHDVSSALLWAKTALRRLINNGWNIGFSQAQIAVT